MIAVVFFSIAEYFLLKKLHPTWWQLRAVRWTTYSLPLLTLVLLLLWSYGLHADKRLFVAIGAYGTASMVVAGICLMVSLPYSGFLHWIDSRLMRRRKRRTSAPVLEERRRILKTASAVFPALALTGGGAGIASAFARPRFPEIRLDFPALPRQWNGLRIAQISDLHLGFILGMRDLEAIVELTSLQHPDLVLITGDFADEAEIYLEALQLVSEIPARLGVFASIGNHEYFRGIEEIFQAYAHSKVPLLLNSGRSLGEGLYLAGLDDPKTLSRTPNVFYESSIKTAVSGAPKDSFIMLMCHRPEGFDSAAANGIPLTLAGHTHGGQIGIFGKGLLEVLAIKRYMWGLYENNGCKLYTSSGAGHWFPYRLGCNSEIPIFVLNNSRA
jgi:predicted MPP superfamily phosphohydrolase